MSGRRPNKDASAARLLPLHATRAPHLDAHELVAPLLKALDDVAHQAWRCGAGYARYRAGRVRRPAAAAAVDGPGLCSLSLSFATPCPALSAHSPPAPPSTRTPVHAVGLDLQESAGGSGARGESWQLAGERQARQAAPLPAHYRSLASLLLHTARGTRTAGPTAAAAKGAP